MINCHKKLMVATYVEIIFGVRLTDKEACSLILGMTDDEYEKLKNENDGIGVFSICQYDQEYDFNCLGTFYKNEIILFTCVCCSKTTDVIVGVSLRKIYRVQTSCRNCKKYTLCDTCFNTTEQGIIDYEQTYSFAECPAENICNHCNSYNNKCNETCNICKRELVPFKQTTFLEDRINNSLGIKKIARLYFHWDDCCSCT